MPLINCDTTQVTYSLGPFFFHFSNKGKTKKSSNSLYISYLIFLPSELKEQWCISVDCVESKHRVKGVGWLGWARGAISPSMGSDSFPWTVPSQSLLWGALSCAACPMLMLPASSQFWKLLTGQYAMASEVTTSPKPCSFCVGGPRITSAQEVLGYSLSWASSASVLSLWWEVSDGGLIFQAGFLGIVPSHLKSCFVPRKLAPRPKRQVKFSWSFQTGPQSDPYGTYILSPRFMGWVMYRLKGLQEKRLNKADLAQNLNWAAWSKGSKESWRIPKTQGPSNDLVHMYFTIISLGSIKTHQGPMLWIMMLGFRQGGLLERTWDEQKKTVEKSKARFPPLLAVWSWVSHFTSPSLSGPLS